MNRIILRFDTIVQLTGISRIKLHYVALCCSMFNITAITIIIMKYAIDSIDENIKTRVSEPASARRSAVGVTLVKAHCTGSRNDHRDMEDCC